jgi:hypothetical protein
MFIVSDASNEHYKFSTQEKNILFCNMKAGKLKYGGGQNTTSLVVVIKQHVSAYSKAIFRFTKC